ncbi:MAG TPA: GntR family transcriptional regulator [Burkholderiales bacterium]|nr:GntR family transcriptional regulator [Burkholderiales bacterium]
MATKRPAAGGRKRPAADHSLTDQAYARLEELIVTLELAPGEVVSEAALSAQLGIGRTPIREALHRLARERLVNILPRRGVVVSEVDVGAQLRLLEVRREIERLVARSAACRATAAEQARFAGLAKGFEAAAKAGDETAFMRTDRAFNELSLVAARNEYASGAMSLMHALSRRFWFIHYRQAADMPLAAKLHAAVARAIANGDGAAAAAASDALIDYIEAFTRSTADPVRA